MCPCGEGEHTVEHLLFDCVSLARQRKELLPADYGKCDDDLRRLKLRSSYTALSLNSVIILPFLRDLNCRQGPQQAGLVLGECWLLKLPGDFLDLLLHEFRLRARKFVKRDVAWQLARDEAHRRGHLPPKTWIERNGENPWRNKNMQNIAEADLGYIYEGFSQAMRDIAEGKSIVRCNFSVGTPWDVESIIEERRGRSEVEWNEDWFTHSPRTWETVSPLPSWADCLREDVLPADADLSASVGVPILAE
ncbi:hypothetical protein CGCVW01_v012404 [Colletotrichum viniferum]|nr:hypothetical protein CGCVW01_v012404 [Colletotrichum viniferum]